MTMPGSATPRQNGMGVCTQIRMMGLFVVADGAGLAWCVRWADGLVGVVSLPGGLD